MRKLLYKNKININDRICKINGIIFGFCSDVINVLDNITNIETANWTLLMIAAYTGKINILETLMEFGDKSYLNDNDKGITALMLASINNRLSAIEKLIELGADMYLKNEKGQDFFDIASENLKKEIIDTVGDKNGMPFFTDSKKI